MKEWKDLPREIKENILCDILSTDNAILVYKIIGNDIKYCRIFKYWNCFYPKDCKSIKDLKEIIKIVEELQINSVKNDWKNIERIPNPSEAVQLTAKFSKKTVVQRTNQ